MLYLSLLLDTHTHIDFACLNLLRSFKKMFVGKIRSKTFIHNMYYKKMVKLWFEIFFFLLPLHQRQIKKYSLFHCFPKVSFVAHRSSFGSTDFINTSCSSSSPACFLSGVLGAESVVIVVPAFVNFSLTEM